MEIRLLEWRSFLNGKKQSAFGLVLFFSPAPIISVVPVEADRSPDRLAFAISSPPTWPNSARKENGT
jgi:hypothetical protein